VLEPAGLVVAGDAGKRYDRFRDRIIFPITDARSRLEACGHAYIRFALESPARFKLMSRPELTGPAEEASVARSSTPALDTLTAAILEAQAAGLAPAGDPRPLVLTCWSAVHGLASLWLDGPLSRAQRAFATSPEKLSAIVPATLTLLLTGAARAGARQRQK